MKSLIQVNIKNRQHYFFNTMTNIKNVDPGLFSIDQISFKGTDFVIYLFFFSMLNINTFTMDIILKIKIN